MNVSPKAWNTIPMIIMMVIGLMINPNTFTSFPVMPNNQGPKDMINADIGIRNIHRIRIADYRTCAANGVNGTGNNAGIAGIKIFLKNA